jgi:prevent-host-death family protein
MDKIVSAAEANREFSSLLRGVREGQTYVVTSHGKPVARIIPAGDQEPTLLRAREALLARLEKEPIVDVGRWTRAELYEDDK